MNFLTNRIVKNTVKWKVQLRISIDNIYDKYI